MATVRENDEFVRAIMPQFPLDDAVEWIAKNLSPDDVFSEDQLGTWANDNGYVVSPEE